MIIDAHSHWLPDDIIQNAHFYHKGWGDIQSQLNMMESAGIDAAVLSYPTSDAHLKLGSISMVARMYNDAVGGMLKRYPGKFFGAAVLPVDSAPGMIAELRRCTDELGFRAISLASSYNGLYLDDPLFHPVYKEAQKKNIPIFVHAQIVNPIGSERIKDPLLTPVIEYVFDVTACIGRLLMADILRDYPGVHFVFAGFGGAVPFLQHRFDAVYRMLRGINFVKDLGGPPSGYLRNIFVDTAGDSVTANFLSALELFGPKQILWGSDWPAQKDPPGSMKALDVIKLPEQDRDDILGGNAARLLGEGAN